jgi:hypothetical protein
MRFLRRTEFWRRLPRRVCAVVALSAYVVAAVGFPLPAVASRPNGIPFPCQGHRCGCQSAEQCWRSCCCFSAEEHLSWARANHVEPPAFATRPEKTPAPKSWNTRRGSDQPARHACADCERRAAPAPRAAGCCQPNATAADHPAEPNPAPAQPSGTRWVGGPSALGCHGASTVWISTGAVTPPPAHLRWQPCAPPAGWLGSSGEHPIGLAVIPPDPPPRLTQS